MADFYFFLLSSSSVAFTYINSQPKRKSKSFFNKVLEDTSVGQSIIFSQTEKMIAKSTGGHYPAPTAILDTIKYGLTHKKPEALEYEATRFAELAATSVSAALRGIFTGM